ncbi:MAG: CRISPR-associated endonuclease Cas1 [Chloroflexi bacterium]|nr:MAG: CRISPR-associated endonuclease Cas1 [Chloroflexota bacterium]
MPIIEHLIVDEFGAYVGKYSGRLKVTKKGETLAQAPLLHLNSVLISNRGVSVSAEAVRACAERGIPLYYVSGSGTAYAMLYSAGLTGTIATRRAQVQAYETERGVMAARAFALGKIQNQANLLKYMVKNYKDSQPDLYAEVRRLAIEVLEHEAELDRLEATCIDQVREQILGTEGRAAQRYWAGVRLVLRADLGWPGRETRGATDPFNQALNYGYGVLYGQIERVILLAGLDPYAGFLHADRPGKPSLVLDLIEEFRQQVVDRTIIGLVNKGVAIGQTEHGRLDRDTRRLLAERVLERLESPVRYEGKRHRLGAVMQMQARHLATFLRGERETYEPFVGSW